MVSLEAILFREKFKVRGGHSMIKNTKIEFSAKEAKLLLRAVDAAASEFTKTKEDRTGDFRWMSESDIETLKTLRYTFQAEHARAMIVDMTTPDD
jgi:rRNA maturation endonuclease Nob1